jgi:O-antigen/teichoic acid export membrane protein
MCHGRRRGEALASYASSTLVHQAAVSLLASGGLLVLAGVISAGVGPPSFRPVAWVLAGVMPLLLLREFVRRFAFAHFRVRAAIAFDLAVSVMQLSGLLLLAWFHRLSIPAVYLVIGGSCGVACAAWFVAGAHPWRFTPAHIAADWRDHWSFGRWALAGQLAGLTCCVLPWMLERAHGVGAAGVWGTCNQLVGPASLFIMGMTNSFFPKAAHAFAHGGGPEVARVMRATMLMFVAVLGTFCLAAWFAGDLLLVLFGRGYVGNGAVVAVLALAALADALGMTAGGGLWAMHRPKANFAADVVQTVVTFAVAGGLVVPLGALGIAIAMVAGRSAGAAVRWFMLRLALAAAPDSPALEATT